MDGSDGSEQSPVQVPEVAHPVAGGQIQAVASPVVSPTATTAPAMSCDEAMRHVGGLGFLQQWILFACSITWFLGAMQLQSYVLFAIPLASQEAPSYLTVHDGGIPMHYRRAPTEAECANRDAAPLTVEGDDLVAEYNLICDDVTKIPMLGSAVFLGQAFGSAVFPAVSDFVGRKLGLRIVMAGVTFAGILAVFSSSFWMYMVAKGLQGFFAGPAGIIAYIYSAEISCGAESKSMTVLFFNGGFAMGQILIVLMSTLTSSWRIMEIITLVFCVIGTISLWFVYESPLWLASVGRLDEARQVFVSLAKMNKKSPPGAIFDEEPQSTEPGCHPELVEGHHVRHLVLSCITYIVLNIGFYGIAAASSEFGNVYVNMLIISFFTVVSFFVCIWGFSNVGKRVTNVFCMSAAIGFCAIAIFTSGGMRQMFVQIMTFAVNVVLSGNYIYRAELFATASRGKAGGIISFLGKIGGASGTFISVLAPSMALVLLGVIYAIAAVSYFYLPETRGVPVEEIFPKEKIRVLHEMRQNYFFALNLIKIFLRLITKIINFDFVLINQLGPR